MIKHGEKISGTWNEEKSTGGQKQKMTKIKISGIEEVGCGVTVLTEIVMGQKPGMSFFDRPQHEQA